MTDKNTPAFPRSYMADGHNGITMRDYFAGQALAGEFAAQSDFCGDIDNHTSDYWMLERAQTFYRMADAMMAVREE